MLIAALFIIVRTWKQPRCPSTEANEMITNSIPLYSSERLHSIINGSNGSEPQSNIWWWSGSPQGRGRGRTVGASSDEDTRTQPTLSTQQRSLGFTETEVATRKHSWVCASSSAYTLWLLSLVFLLDSIQFTVCLWVCWCVVFWGWWCVVVLICL